MDEDPLSLTTDRNDPALKAGQRETGQNDVYLVLSEEERAKGFVRPVRHSYVHNRVKNPTYPLRDLTDEERVAYAKFGYVKFETYPEDDSLTGSYWTQEGLDRGEKGCGAKTTMGQALAETYARNPTFYGATFCVACNRHLPVTEFTWDGTSEIVGS